MRIWNVARTGEQIRQFMSQSVNPSDSALVLNYRFNETSGNNVIDSRPSSPQHGMLAGGASRLPVVEVATTLSGLEPGNVHHTRAAEYRPSLS